MLLSDGCSGGRNSDYIERRRGVMHGGLRLLGELMFRRVEQGIAIHNVRVGIEKKQRVHVQYACNTFGITLCQGCNTMFWETVDGQDFAPLRECFAFARLRFACPCHAFR